MSNKEILSEEERLLTMILNIFHNKTPFKNLSKKVEEEGMNKYYSVVLNKTNLLTKDSDGYISWSNEVIPNVETAKKLLKMKKKYALELRENEKIARKKRREKAKKRGVSAGAKKVIQKAKKAKQAGQAKPTPKLEKPGLTPETRKAIADLKEKMNANHEAPSAPIEEEVEAKNEVAFTHPPVEPVEETVILPQKKSRWKRFLAWMNR